MELQMHMEEVVQDLNRSSLPIRDYQTYCLFSLFPEYHLSLVKPTNPLDPSQSAREANPSSWGSLSGMAGGRVSPMSLYGGEEYVGMPHPCISAFQVGIFISNCSTRVVYSL